MIFIPTILDLSNNLAKPEVAPSGGLFVKQDRKRFEFEHPSFVLALADCNLTRLRLITTPDDQTRLKLSCMLVSYTNRCSH